MSTAVQMSFLSDQDTFNSLCAYWAANHPEYISCLRAMAMRICVRTSSAYHPGGRVTIDDIREEMETMHIPMPTQIGADDRMLGSVLRGCRELRPIGVEKTRRADWAKRIGQTRSMVTVYTVKE